MTPTFRSFCSPSGSLVALVTAAGLAAVGCKPAGNPPAAQPAVHQDHAHDDHHDHPETLAAGVAELRKVATKIAADLSGGSREAADEAVHEVGHLLEDLSGLVADAKVPAELAATAKQAIADLEESFGKLDEALHAADGQGESPAEVHASVKDRIESALGTLEKIEK